MGVKGLAIYRLGKAILAAVRTGSYLTIIDFRAHLEPGEIADFHGYLKESTSMSAHINLPSDLA